MTVRVKIENAYSDGHESSKIVLVEPPAATAGPALEDWWEETVYPHTGDGHGIDADVEAYYSATVLGGHPDLIDLTREWG